MLGRFASRTGHGRWLVPLVLALILLGVLSFVLLPPRTSGLTLPAEGGTFTEASAGPVQRVNPLLAATPAERTLAGLVFAGLTRSGPGGESIPDLAEDWEATPDSRVFTFRLRRGLFWHDGEPLTIDDVIFTMELVKAGAGTDARLAEVWRDATVTRVDGRRVQVALPAPLSALPAYASFGILPAHLLRDVPPAALGDAPFNQQPVGSGPFRLLELTDEQARLGRFDRYHLNAPYLDAITVRINAPAGEVDAALLGPGESPASRTVYALARPAYAAVFLNNDQALFASDTVRRALSLAVDRRGLVARTVGGGGIPTDVPFAPGSWAHDGVIAPGVDLDAARSLLDAAGWTPGPDGVLRRGNRDLRFTLVTLDDPAWLAIARLLADGWATLGARVTVAPTSQAQLVNEFINPRAYEAALIGWDPGPDPDPFAGWHSSLRGQPGGNPANFADERSDELLVEGRVQPDPEARQTRYGLFQARFRELAPSVILFAEAVRYAVNPAYQLSLPATVPDDAARFSDVRRWHINTRQGPRP